MSSRRYNVAFYVILLGAALGILIQTATAQDYKEFSRPRTVTKATSVRTISPGQEITLTGNIIKVEGDTFSICDFKGAETIVVVPPGTKITTHRRGIFRGAETLDKEAFMIGLRVQARGRGNDSGGLTAKWVRFHDADLRAQTQLDARAVPIEAEQVKQWEQMEETHGVATTALKNAKTAQDSADKAQQSADKAQGTADSAKTDAANANNTALGAHARIAALDDFEVTEGLTINFKAGSWKLTPAAKAQLDEFAAKTLSAKGYVLEVSGFASKEGGRFYNHELSAKRTEMVMDYLIGTCNVPIRRVQTPYSGGILNPVADNKTRAGRAENRRVEVKMLVSKGLTAKEQQVTASQR